MIYEIIFNDEGTPHTKLLRIPDNKTFQEIYERVIDYITKGNYPCMSHNIPDEYWIKAGASLLDEPVTVININSYQIVPEQTNVIVASCRTCDHFESGVCMKYGGHCNPDNKDNTDCYRYDDESAYIITYDDTPLEAFILDDNSDPNTDIGHIISEIIKINGFKTTLDWLNDRLTKQQESTITQSDLAYQNFEIIKV